MNWKMRLAGKMAISRLKESIPAARKYTIMVLMTSWNNLFQFQVGQAVLHRMAFFYVNNQVNQPSSKISISADRLADLGPGIRKPEGDRSGIKFYYDRKTVVLVIYLVLNYTLSRTVPNWEQMHLLAFGSHSLKFCHWLRQRGRMSCQETLYFILKC